jgi:hypothetical protein
MFSYAMRIMDREEFNALVTRLSDASELLRSGGSLMQAIARRYYVVYTYATQAAEKHQIKFRRGTDVHEARRLTHQALPDIVRALYTGQNCNAVFGSGPRRDSGWAIDRRSGRSIC